jgi:hypothetical protein
MLMTTTTLAWLLENLPALPAEFVFVYVVWPYGLDHLEDFVTDVEFVVEGRADATVFAFYSR